MGMMEFRPGYLVKWQVLFAGSLNTLRTRIPRRAPSFRGGLVGGGS